MDSMSDEDFMKLAIEEAKNSQKLNGLPIGAILVNEGEVVATGHFLVWTKKDPTAHAEIECMRNACDKLGRLDLRDFTLYSTLEPCSMCLSCMSWCNISRFVFGATKDDVEDKNKYEVFHYESIELAPRLTPPSGETIEAKGGVLREDCKKLMQGVFNWQDIVQTDLDRT